MHQPETWSFIQFSEKNAGEGIDAYVPGQHNDVKWALRKLFYRGKAYFKKIFIYCRFKKCVKFMIRRCRGSSSARQLN
jgi:hypothetical protein